MKHFTRDEIIFLCVAFLLAVIVRLYFISGNNVLFFFDQARDAHLSRQILEAGDIKIQGPSASGTADQFYHGVLYYYVIAPIYTLFSGNPTIVAAYLGILASLTVIPLFLLARSMLNKKVAYVSVFLFVFSSQATFLSTWLSNPMLALITIPLYYFFFWRVFLQKKYQELPYLLFILGLTNQSIIFSVYLFGSLLFGLIYTYSREKRFVFSLKNIIFSIVSYSLAVATMILTELQLYKNGILSVDRLFQMTQGDQSFLDKISKINQLYSQTIGLSLIPHIVLISSIIGLAVLIFFVATSNWRQRFFIMVWLLAPLTLLFIQSRTSQHTLVGFTPILYIAVAYVVLKLEKLPFGKILISGILLLFAISNLFYIHEIQVNKKNHLGVQLGSSLKDELALIDYTYEKSNGKPFSISTLTNPYSYNTTWGYLYDWYGKKKYHYTPKFFGPDQSQLFAGTLLEAAQKPDDTHFSIYEPIEGMPDKIIEDFTLEQNSLLPLKDTKVFATMKVEERFK